MRTIFVSYRREDSEGQAGRLFDDLERHFGEQSVFMDVAGIDPGRDFRKAIDESVASCCVLLAVMGKNWLNIKEASGRRRLDDPQDFVRLETASALTRDIPVVPVLVQGARMPSAAQLPKDLSDLAFRNAIELTHARWDSDVAMLIAAIERLLGLPPKEPQPPARAMVNRRGNDRWMLATILLSIAVVGGGSAALWKRAHSRQSAIALQLTPDPPKQVTSSDTPPPEPPKPKPLPVQPVSDPPKPKPSPVATPVSPKPAGERQRLAPRLGGRWSWGQPCSDGVKVRWSKGQLVFGAGEAAFVHVIQSDDGTTLRTRVVAPPAHAGDRYEFQLTGSRLSLFEPNTGERNEWTRCAE